MFNEKNTVSGDLKANMTTMYRVGDYVFFETLPNAPYQVRRIEELNKTPNGNVEAKVMCFYRRKDLPPSLTFLADRHQSALEEDEGKERESLTPKQKHILKHRELFLSRQVETLPATQLRGKCSVTLLNETESLLSYINKEDTFFYSLVYDPQQKTLLADRGEIRVGNRYQAEPAPLLKEGEVDTRKSEELETLIWTPDHGLTDKQIDQFLVISRSVGTFARALDCSSSVKQPSLHMNAAAASRDVTLFHAMDTLHQYSYNISQAISALVPSSGPVLCRDEMEEWSASEANLFEEALEKYGKDFTDIRSDFLPWKTLKNIVEYYYMWKTTDRYVQQKRVKAAEAESKLKQVYIPSYNKPSPAALTSNKNVLNGSSTPEPLIPGKPCESCMNVMSTQWYAWTGPTGAQARLCANCWNYWRKYGGFKAPNKLSALEEDEGKERESLTPKQKHILKHRELFLSRQVETLPATQIRGKCSVTLLNETESLLSYINKEDTFFYSLVYDPQQKTLLADRGEIRVGNRYQAEPAPLLKEGEVDTRKSEELETLIWTPDHGLTDKQIDQFLVISRSVGTFARALDCSSSVKQPSLHMSAAAASRDVTLFHAMDTLHQYSYNISQAISALVPSSGPVLCRDEMEEWSASEANLFEEALEKYGKDFTDIRSDFLPWKTLKNIVEYYYMWKTTDRYVQQKRVKAAEAESKLKQVYIPSYNKPSPAALTSNKNVLNGSSTPEPLIPGKPCESCMNVMSTQWYAWTGPTGAQARLCANCWNYWRKYGGFKAPNKLMDADVDLIKKPKIGPSPEEAPVSVVFEPPPVERAPGIIQPRIHRCAVAGCGKEFKMKNQLARHYAQNHGYSMRSGSPRPVMKTRTAFYLHTTPMTRVARRLCGDLVKTRHAARAPFWPINVIVIKQECQTRVTGKLPEELKQLVTGRKRKNPDAKVSDVAHVLGQAERDRVTPEWLILTDKSKLPQPDKVAFPKPPKGPSNAHAMQKKIYGSLIYERVPEKFATIVNNLSPSSLVKKRGFEDVNGVDGPPPKRQAWDPAATPPPSNPPKSSSRGGSPLPLVTQHLPASSNMNIRNVLNHMNGNSKSKLASVTRLGSRKQIISWMDAPDDLYFYSTAATKKLRRSLSSNELRRLARTPCKKALNKGIFETPPAVTVMPAAAAMAATALVVPPLRSPMPM